MAVAVPIIAGIGAVVSAVSSVMQGVSASNAASTNANAARQQASYNQQMAGYNQSIANQQASMMQQNAAYKAGLIQQKADKLRGAQEAGYAKAGVELEGSPLMVMADSAIQAERDVLMTKYQGELDAWKYKMAGVQAVNQGNMSAWESNTKAGMWDTAGSNAMTSGLVNAGGSLLTAAGNYATKMGWGTTKVPTYDAPGKVTHA